MEYGINIKDFLSNSTFHSIFHSIPFHFVASFAPARIFQQLLERIR
jgi:hypothetical protein